jgi:hypothetical protein
MRKPQGGKHWWLGVVLQADWCPPPPRVNISWYIHIDSRRKISMGGQHWEPIQMGHSLDTILMSMVTTQTKTSADIVSFLQLYTVSPWYQLMFKPRDTIDIVWVDCVYKPSAWDVMYCRQRHHLYYGCQIYKYYLSPSTAAVKLHRRAAMSTNLNGTQSVYSRENPNSIL